MRIAVGSNNPVKLKAVETAFKIVWPDEEWIVVGVDAPSGVSDQPMSDKESILGAKNRARQAIEKTQADYGVGLEGGIQKVEEIYFTYGWVVVVDKEGKEGIGCGVRSNVPLKVIDMINQGMELGKASDIIFNKNNSKQNEGYIGLITNNIITRTDGYRDGVVTALSRFLHPEIF